MKITATPNAPAAIGPYSQAIEVNGFLFASGQVPLCPKTGVVVGTTIEEQAKQTCENVKGQRALKTVTHNWTIFVKRMTIAILDFFPPHLV